MILKMFKSSRSHVLLLAAVLLSGFMLIGCGSGGGGSTDSDSYSAPVNTTTATPLISAATLKSWIDADYVKSGAVVVLDYGSVNTVSTKGWIPGAVTVGVNEARMTRVEGVAWAASLVATGEQMDTLIQRAGIDNNSTIVFTSNYNAYMSARLYWTFRYWGFPKSQLKVLDGGNAAFDAAYDMSFAESSPVASSYSVASNSALQDGLRASIGEVLMDVVPDNGVSQLTIDCRGATGYNGSTATAGYFDNVVSGISTHKTVMEGHVSGGTYIDPAAMYVAGKYKTGADLLAIVLGNGQTLGEAIASNDKITVYCTSGYGAARTFFALDALTNANVQLYDGSMSQWMQYAAVVTDANADGYDDNTQAGLPVSSPWSVEPYTDHGVIIGPAYNATDNGVALDLIEKINYLQEEAADFPTPAIVPNQVESADEDYMQSGGASVTPVGAFSDNGGVGC
jgi:3-mercaptopyruvate sulfurtransferase SseA